MVVVWGWNVKWSLYSRSFSEVSEAPQRLSNYPTVNSAAETDIQLNMEYINRLVVGNLPYLTDIDWSIDWSIQLSSHQTLQHHWVSIIHWHRRLFTQQSNTRSLIWLTDWRSNIMIPQSSVSYDPDPKLMYSAAMRAIILKPLSSWSPTPKPDWRSESRPMPSIPEMLKEITAMRSLYEVNKARPEIQRETETFVMRSTINFIFASSRLDGLGLQSYAQTEEVLTEVWHRSEQSSEDVVNAESESVSRFRSRQETVQTLKAMQYLHHDFKEQSQLVRDEVQ